MKIRIYTIFFLLISIGLYIYGERTLAIFFLAATTTALVAYGERRLFFDYEDNTVCKFK